CFFFSSRRRHTRWPRDWSSDVCSSDLFSRPRRPEGVRFLRPGAAFGDAEKFGVLSPSLRPARCRPPAIGFAFYLHTAASGFAIKPTRERGHGGRCRIFAVGWPLCVEAKLN